MTFDYIRPNFPIWPFWLFWEKYEITGRSSISGKWLTLVFRGPRWYKLLEENILESLFKLSQLDARIWVELKWPINDRLSYNARPITFWMTNVRLKTFFRQQLYLTRNLLLSNVVQESTISTVSVTAAKDTPWIGMNMPLLPTTTLDAFQIWDYPASELIMFARWKPIGMLDEMDQCMSSRWIVFQVK